MKKLFTIVCLLVSVVGRGQCNGYMPTINFDGDTCFMRMLTIDTVNYHNNRWQIGATHKAILDSPYSAPNVIITDTLNTYPPNDTSVFSLKIPVTDESRMWWLVGFHFKYRLDIDSSEKAVVEMSIDSGLHWTNVIDTLSEYASWHGPEPRFDTSTNSWLTFDLSWHVTSAPLYTLLFRFTLISDSAAGARDGWMIDDINSLYEVESVHLLQNLNLITLYPNPSHGNIYIHTDKPNKDATITIHNILGQQVYSGAAPTNGYMNLQLPNGVYTLKYSDEEEYCVKQVVIQN